MNTPRIFKPRWFRITVRTVGSLALLLGLAMINACTSMGQRPDRDRRIALAQSPQWKGTRFVNPLERKDAPGMEILAEWVKGADNTSPTDPPPILRRTAEEFAAPPGEEALKVTWLGHSTLLVEVDGQRVLIDPVWGPRASPFTFVGPKRFHEPPLPITSLPPIDAVVISHDHYDHLDYPSIVALKDRTERFVVPLGVGAHLVYWGIPEEKITELDWWESTPCGNLELVATPARHFSGRAFADDQTLWAGWVIKGPNHRLFYSGDTAMHPTFKDIGDRYGPFDVTLMESGAYNKSWADVHMGPEQAVQAHQMLKGKLLIPVHWGTFDLALHAWTEPVERLLFAAEAAGIRAVIPQPGETVDANAPKPLKRWWPQIAWQSAADAPVVSSGLTPPEPGSRSGLPEQYEADAEAADYARIFRGP